MGLVDSPADEELPDVPKLFSWEPLREDVGLLFGGLDVLGHNTIGFSNLGSEEVVFEGEVLVLGGHLGDIDQGEASLVVLKDSGADQACGQQLQVQLGAHLTRCQEVCRPAR